MSVRFGAVAVLVASMLLTGVVVALALASSDEDDAASPDDLDVREHAEGSPFRFADLRWRVRHNGFGAVSTARDGRCRQVDLRPRTAETTEDTHAALAVTTAAAPGTARLEMRAVEQLRRPDPNAWEVAWFIWAYQDDEHFYYFTVKPNGWELGKADPAYPGKQRFLATGDEPRAAVGTWVDVEVEHRGETSTVHVDGEEVVTFVDEERPYRHGSLGMYTEDAHVQFRPPGC